MASKYININYPFKNSDKGFFLDLTFEDNSAIKADLLHLILTQKGQRFYNPSFGTNLLKFIFEPNEQLTFSAIKGEIETAITKYLPNLKLKNLIIEESADDNHVAIVTLEYEITDNLFSTQDSVTINI